MPKNLLQNSELREKLQKFAQYLLNELPKSHLSTAQEILDKLLGNDSDDMNILPGGPDPTAGSTYDDDNEWFLDKEALTGKSFKHFQEK